MHELAHALTARRFGGFVGGIHLHLLGGVAMIGSYRPFKPKEDFYIAAAGPASNFVAMVPLMLLATITGFEVFLWAAAINFMLGAFNLIPAFPMDGGRILRAGLQMMNYNRATAVKITQSTAIFFGILFIFFGIPWGNFGLTLIGGFVLAAVWWERKGNRI
jgi:Zn-dependent protease